MANVKETSLLDALAYCDLRSLPKEWDKQNVYILAIGLVSKSDGTFNYVSMKKDVDGKDTIVKDFGNISAINRIEKVFPYKFLDESYMPVFKTKGKDERIEWLTKYGTKGDYSNMSLKELEKEILNNAMRQALVAINK